jgi:hypothetical protein
MSAEVKDALVDETCFSIVRDLTYAMYVEDPGRSNLAVAELHHLSPNDHRPDLYAREMLRYRVSDRRKAPGELQDGREWVNAEIKRHSLKVHRLTKRPADVFLALEQAVRPRIVTKKHLWGGYMILGASVALACLTSNFDSDMQVSREHLEYFCRNCPNWVRGARLNDDSLIDGPRI